VDALLSGLRDGADRKAAPAPFSPASVVWICPLDEQGFGRLLAEAGLGSMAAVNAALGSLAPPARE
jgi:hypothetical protein